MDLRNAELTVLYDTLSITTEQYTHMLAENYPLAELEYAKRVIIELQDEIDLRKIDQDNPVLRNDDRVPVLA